MPGDCRLSLRAQASALPFCAKPGGVVRSAMLLAVCALPLASCASGFDLSKADVDDMTQTGTVAAGQASDPVRASDETIIRNAVSAADPEATQVQPLAWANADTGSRGAITNLVEKQQDGTLCRQFTASRESFDGVALFTGDACKASGGAWYLRSFKPL
jgi:surface antigen